MRTSTYMTSFKSKWMSDQRPKGSDSPETAEAMAWRPGQLSPVLRTAPNDCPRIRHAPNFGSAPEPGLCGSAGFNPGVIRTYTEL